MVFQGFKESTTWKIFLKYIFVLECKGVNFTEELIFCQNFITEQTFTK